MTKKAEGELSRISQPLDLLPPTVSSALNETRGKNILTYLTENFKSMNH